ncbi:hypothetical protein PVAND_017542 [Polypedilum vanderplanki]|uniref:Uncharacterized protein n=1 Tax=Polypedilum vanderplanki TaxID=319348 RepID=A0A9J6BJC4_POLVA|nr:hypothetical protein PVAND_017542 [Polypedilum vanderplanki]
MDPSKIQGKIREQMKREIKARIDSEKKWSFMSKPENNQFYNQTFLNLKVAEKFGEKSKDETTANQEIQIPQSQGESYFVSKVMYDSMNLCRCGRKKEGTHLIKCLQKCVIKYSDGQISTGATPSGEKDTSASPNIPRTTNDIFGFYQSKYKNLEKSTFYVTPKVHLKHKITDNIYNNIIIG